MIRFTDLQPALLSIKWEMEEAIQKVLESAQFVRGPNLRAFEEEWAAYCGHKYCVTCASCTDALSFATSALKIREAFVPATAPIYTAVGLVRGGAKVRPVDVTPQGHLYIAEPNGVAVPLYGRQLNQDDLDSPILDAAQSHGHQPGPKQIACWSFFPTKSLGAMGDGGAITTNDQGLAQHIAEMAGREEYPDMSRRESTSRMAEIQAAVLRVKLKHLNIWIAERKGLAHIYCQFLPKELIVYSATESNHYLFPIRHPDRHRIAQSLAEKGIETKIHFDRPLHTYPQFSVDADLPNADSWCQTVLSLPCYPGLTLEKVKTIAAAVQEALQ